MREASPSTVWRFWRLLEAPFDYLRWCLKENRREDQAWERLSPEAQNLRQADDWP